MYTLNKVSEHMLYWDWYVTYVKRKSTIIAILEQ